MGTCSPPPPQDGRASRQYCITVSRADAALIERVRALLGLGKSEFFQRLLHEGIGAKLPLLGGGGK